MQNRRKIFLTFSLFCILPLLVISITTFVASLKFHQRLVEQDLEREVMTIESGLGELLRDREIELKDVAANPTMRKYVTPLPDRLRDRIEASQSHPASHIRLAPAGNQLEEVRQLLAHLLRYGKFYATIEAYSPRKQLLFAAGPPPPHGNGDIEFRTTELLPQQIQPDENVWTSHSDEPLCTVAGNPTFGKSMRCTLPILTWEQDLPARGALVADIKLDELFRSVAHRFELTPFGDSAPPTVVMAFDESGEIVYHTDPALKHQQVSTSIPSVANVANAMTAGQSGKQFYEQTNGDEWLAAYKPLLSTRLSLAVSRNYSRATREVRLLGWLGIGVALLIGAIAAVFLTNYYARKSKSIDRVAEGVDEIAKGKLDHRIELLSSDDLRPLADNVGLVTKQLREQIAREAESRQFQSFVRLSAILTHDLKNAIEALSLIVSNMEHHFENKEFRADAMQSLTAATDKLRALVTRLSNPVNTLSGEHKRPRPVDLVPILKRVIALTAEPARAKHEIHLKLPQSLFALIDGDRMDKVIENLTINALEAMDDRRGTLTIEAGETENGKPFFSVSDTGEGMNERFIAERLFRPFATTKRKGVGLGLYTCREVVNANGGTIEVDSQEGTGTRFTVVLPSVANEAT